MCNDRWAQMGYPVEPLCPLCGMRDSLTHRVWFCTDPDVVHARNELVETEMLARARENFLDPFWTTGIFQHPAEDPRFSLPPVSDGIELRDASGHLVDDINLVNFNSPVVASDGSLKRTGNIDLDRAAWAAVFADEHLKIQCILTGPVWAGFPQSSQAAEHIGAAMPAMLAEGPYKVFSDSVQAVRQGSPQELAKLSPKAMYAGVWKTAKHVGLHHMTKISHVRAHRTEAQRALLSAEEVKVSDLNEAADNAAKERAQALQVDESLRADYKKKVAEARIVIRTIAATLKQFPKPDRLARAPPLLTSAQRLAVRLSKKRQRAAEKQAIAQLLRTHAWEQAGCHFWRCVRCLEPRWSRDEPQRSFECAVTPALNMLRQSTEPTEHDLWAVQLSISLSAGNTSAKPVLVWCRRCWCYSSSRLLNLKKTCCNTQLHNRAIHNRNRIQRGKHPITDDTFVYSGAVRVQRQYDFIPKLRQEQGLVAVLDEVMPSDRSELSFATTPDSFVPHLDDLVWQPSDNDLQVAHADLQQLAADGFAVG